MQTIWVGRQRADIVFASSPRSFAAGPVQRSVLPRPCLQGVRKISPIFAADSGLILIISSYFLYWQSVSSEAQKGSHPTALNKTDAEELPLQSPGARSIWNAAVSYYANSPITRDLLFDREMEAIKNQVEDAETSPDLTKVQIPVELKNLLLTAAPIYRKY